VRTNDARDALIYYRRNYHRVGSAAVHAER
jgi:hypothetical protein